jgi:hypothetical protein
VKLLISNSLGDINPAFAGARAECVIANMMLTVLKTLSELLAPPLTKDLRAHIGVN